MVNEERNTGRPLYRRQLTDGLMLLDENIKTLGTLSDGELETALFHTQLCISVLQALEWRLRRDIRERDGIVRPEMRTVTDPTLTAYGTAPGR